MTIAFDAVGYPASEIYTATFSWTHTPVGTPRGVAVVVVQEGSTDQVSGVTYGGVTMTRVATYVRTTTEAGRVYLYFLGAGVLTGARTVQVTLTGTQDTNACSLTVTSAAVDTQVDVYAGGDAGIIANPSLTIVPTVAAVIFYGLFSGLAAPVTTVQTGSTHIKGNDYGTDSAMWARKSVGAGSTTIGYTAASDDVCHGALAIKESTAQTFPISCDGTVGALSGALERKTGKQVTGVLVAGSLSGVVSKVTAKVLAGTAGTLTGSLVKSTSKAFGGTAGSLSGILVNAKKTLLALAGTMGSLAGSLANVPTYVLSLSGIAGVLSGTISKATSKSFSGQAGALSGGLSKSTGKQLSGAPGAISGSIGVSYTATKGLSGIVGSLLGSLSNVFEAGSTAIKLSVGGAITSISGGLQIWKLSMSDHIKTIWRHIRSSVR